MNSPNAIPAPPPAAPPNPPALVVEGLSHSFGKTAVLKDVGFRLGQGELGVLLGPNGAGKTTLFALLTRLYHSRAGKIAVAGHDLARAPGPALAALGVVFQSRALDTDLSLAQNLLYHAALHGIGRARARARMDAVLALVGLQDRAGQRAGSLSGGQQRRAEIARALLHRPQVLLLDEATAGLDLQSRAEVLALLRGLVRDHGVSLLMATHVFSEVEQDDRVILLHRGRVIDQGRAADLARGHADLAAAFLARTGAGSPAGPQAGGGRA